MPGIDGWETIRRLRRLGLERAKVAVVSANAFDKNLDNDAGVRAEDFILKPVRHTELLDWLERQLGLRWSYAQAPSQPPGAGGADMVVARTRKRSDRCRTSCSWVTTAAS